MYNIKILVQVCNHERLKLGESMAIHFDMRGNPTPYEVVPIDFSVFKSFFASLPDQDHRSKLVQRLDQYVADYEKYLAPRYWKQWYGGSFVTNKKNPRDIDVVNVIQIEDPDPGRVQQLHTNPYVGADSHAIYAVDGYWIPWFNKNDPRRRITDDKIGYWTSWFGKDREGNPKAIIEVNQK